MPRCSLCDYAEGLGSDLMGIPANPNIRVRFSHVHGDYICTECESSVDDTLADFNDEEEEVEDLEDDE
jgi:hypothetical protein